MPTPTSLLPRPTTDGDAVPTVRSSRPRITVVVPTLNEARNLPLALATLPDDVDEVIVVDGRSTDGTVEVARACRPDARIVLEERPGKGAALQAGFAAATGDVIVMFDADGSAHGGEIPRFVDALVAGADFAKGSRFMAGGGSDDITWLRRLGNAVLCAVVNRSFGARYTDLAYGYNAFWRHCLPALGVDCDGFEVETHINIRLATEGLAVTEVPSYELDRIYGESNLHVVRDGLRVLRTILKERVRRFRRGAGSTPAPRALPPAAADDVIVLSGWEDAA